MMMSSASTPDFRGSIRRSQQQQQRRTQTPQLSHSSSIYGLSAQAKSAPPVLQQQQQPQTASTTTIQVVAQPDTRALDPTFEPLERAGRAINDALRKDDRFPELDTLVQRIHLSLFPY